MAQTEFPTIRPGLLKRKFKYQYGQRGRQSGSNAEEW